MKFLRIAATFKKSKKIKNFKKLFSQKKKDK